MNGLITTAIVLSSIATYFLIGYKVGRRQARYSWEHNGDNYDRAFDALWAFWCGLAIWPFSVWYFLARKISGDGFNEGILVSCVPELQKQAQKRKEAKLAREREDLEYRNRQLARDLERAEEQLGIKPKRAPTGEYDWLD